MLSAVMKGARSVISADQKGSHQVDVPQPRELRHDSRSRIKAPSCVHDFAKAISLLSLCISLIVKGVSYDNSHWANHDELDVVNNKDRFPIMTSFLDNVKLGKHENCRDLKCRIFFDKYAAMKTLSSARGTMDIGGSESSPLRGTVSRGINRRCERVTLLSAGETALGATSFSKYEKCKIDKQSEVNEFKTIRYLLVSSMMCDAFGLLNWIAILSYSGHPATSSLARLFLVCASLSGFISSLLTGIGLGLFLQAVDIFEEAYLYLGWPFYAVCLSIFFSMISAVTSSTRLREASQLQEITCSKQHLRHRMMSPSISIIDLAGHELSPSDMYLPYKGRLAITSRLPTMENIEESIVEKDQDAKQSKPVLKARDAEATSAFRHV